MDRIEATRAFYALVEELERRIGGRWRVLSADGQRRWPERGVYFLFEPGERRSGSGLGSRVVHVGTHALTAGSDSTMWSRVRKHRGTTAPPGGNHRVSGLRERVGSALMARTPTLAVATWGRRLPDAADSDPGEDAVEVLVTRRIRAMSIVFLPIDDEPGPDSQRGYVARNSVALLSGFTQTPVDPPSMHWLGRWSPCERVSQSGLWKPDHVDDPVDPGFMDVLTDLVRG